MKYGIIKKKRVGEEEFNLHQLWNKRPELLLKEKEKTKKNATKAIN